MEPDKVRRHSVIFFQDATRLRRDDMDRIKEAFSPDRYPQVKQQLENAYRYEMAVTRQVQNEIKPRIRHTPAPNNGQGIGDSPAHSRAPRRRQNQTQPQIAEGVRILTAPIALRGGALTG